MIKRIHLQFVFILCIALLLTFFKIPIASSQGVQLVSSRIDGDLPVNDPESALWQKATAVEVPLSAQNVTKPFLLNTKIKSITARVLQNANQLAVLLEWDDATQDDSTVRIQDFRDAAALQFPQVQGQPFFCMGQQGGNVNLWHWKADWQADITARKEMEDQYPNMYVDDYPFAQPVEGNLARAADYTDQNYLPALKAGNLFAATSLSSPVEDINAGGFGTLTAQPSDEQNVQGLGVWKDGTWLVIFSRDLASAEKDDVSFAPGKSYSVAFAIWDGSNGERNGQKSTSQWVTLQLRDAPQAPKAEEPKAPDATVRARNITLVVVGFLGILILIGALIYRKLPN